MENEERTVLRDCPATIIPSGESIMIPKDSKVVITHRLGGNFTVTWAYGMARIAGQEAEALGEELVHEVTPKESEYKGAPDEEAIWEQLKTVFDPEIPVNIVDLGLVYSMEVEKTQTDSYRVEIKMTLTAPGCGMGPAIAEDAKERVSCVPGVTDANVEIVWDPPWQQDMISEEGKMQLGLI